MNYYNRILFLAPLLIFNYSFSQDYNAQQKKLEAQKLSIKKEIEKINVLVSENKKMTITLLDNIEDVELKISVRNKLIEVNNQQSKNLSNQIKNKNDRIYYIKGDSLYHNNIIVKRLLKCSKENMLFMNKKYNTDLIS